MDTKSRKPTKKLPQVQVLRGLAASAVVFHHYSLGVADSGGKPSWIVDSGIGQLGAAGVDIFFVISGFIMMYTTRNYSGFGSALSFLRRRAQRIYPLYWLWTTVLLLLRVSHLVPIAHTRTVKFFVKSYLLVPEFNGVHFHPFLGQGWTLSFEMMFYCVFSVAILFGVLPSWRIYFVAGTFALLQILGRLAPIDQGLGYLWTSSITLEFLFGMLAGYILLTREDRGAKALSAFLPPALLLLGIVSLAASLKVPYSESLRFLLWGVPSFVIVLGCVLLRSQENSVTKPLVYLGDASYSVYLAHGFFSVGYVVMCKHFSALHNASPDATIVLGGILTIIVTASTYRLIEVPILDAVSEKRRRPSVAAIASKVGSTLPSSEPGHSVSDALIALNRVQEAGRSRDKCPIVTVSDLQQGTTDPKVGP